MATRQQVVTRALHAHGWPKQEPTVTAWLRERMVSGPFGRDRCCGISSDALAAFAIGGPRPVVPGHPVCRGAESYRGDECGSAYPHDLDDLRACERTWLMAPDHERAIMLPVLEEFQRYVIDGLNRYGEAVRERAAVST